MILVDGVWVGSWCMLIALSSTNHVLGWQWAARESTAAWEALFMQILEPAIIVTDGGSGIRSALARTWPETKIQRCVFHIQLGVTRELTRNPRTEAGRRLRGLATARPRSATSTPQTTPSPGVSRSKPGGNATGTSPANAPCSATDNSDSPTTNSAKRGTSCTAPLKPGTSSPTSPTTPREQPHDSRA